jgi:uncharacterized protein (DUF302 family)
MNASGTIDLPCKDSVAVTVSRLESVLQAKGFAVFARIDQAEEADSVGLTLRPMVLLIFGNSKAGIPVIIKHPSIAIDLPLKALVWESADGKAWITYNSPEFLQQRHGLPLPPFEPIATILQAVAQDSPIK